ncbi:hypothetical protein BH09ACT8_BH09ACT8_49510 [soil metagenome]
MHVFLVTNADTSAGFHIASELLRSGHRVVVTGTKATALVRITHGHSSDRVLAIAADVSVPDQLRRLVSRAESRFGAIEFMVGPDGVPLPVLAALVGAPLIAAAAASFAGGRQRILSR